MESSQDADVESSLAAVMMRVDGEEATGRSDSSSSISSFRRYQSVCDDTARSFRKALTRPGLEQVNQEFSDEYRVRDRSYFIQEKMVTSKLLEHYS